MKRALHVMYSLERSGMETMLLCSAREWGKHDFACDVLATSAHEGPLAAEMRAAGYGVHHIPSRSRRSHYRLPLASLWRFVRLARQFDVVHIHVESAATMYALLARLAGVQVIARSIHNTFLFEGFLRFRKRVSRGLCRSMGVTFGMISDSVAQCERERFSNTGVRTWNWFDVEYFRPASEDERQQARRQLHCDDERTTLVSVGNCNEAKNHTALLEALVPIAKQTPIRYLHVGREEAAQPERVLAERLGVSVVACFEGSQADPRAYFWAADVFVMPSLYEGLAIAALEAIASGCSVVLSDVNGLCEVLAAAPHAQPMGTTPESIAGALMEIIAKPSQDRRRLALSDSAAVREMFSPQRGVEGMVRLLYREAGGAS